MTQRWFSILFGLAALFGTGCRESNGPEFGSVTVTVFTSGADIDPDGYVVFVDGVARGAIPVNASLTLEGVRTGTRNITLSGVATNCTATPTVAITPAVRTSVAAAAFQVVCVERVGTVIVTTTTTGTDHDPDGYLLGVESTSIHAISVSSVDTVRSVREGDRVLLLTGLATNCHLSGPATQTLSITFADTVYVALAVNCVPRRGSIRVATSTSSTTVLTDFLFQIDGGSAVSIPPTGAVDVSNLAEGSYSVTLSGFPSNCVVQGANPRSVTVVHGQVASMLFMVLCETGTSVSRAHGTGTSS